MKKERINEIKKGLENDIYSKIKDIEVEKREESKFNSSYDLDYESTDFLADILPPKEETNDTIQILDKNSVDLELDRDALLKKYDEYIYNDSQNKSVGEKTNAKMDSIKEAEDTEDLILNHSFAEEVSLKDIHEKVEPSIPPFQTEEHLEQIARDLEDVELKYKEEERQKIEEISEKLLMQQKREEVIEPVEQEAYEQVEHNEELEEEPVFNQPMDEQTIIAPKTSYEYIDDPLIPRVGELSQMNEAPEDLDLSNDFVQEDQIKIPDEDEIVIKPSSPLEDSQFIFEQDIEDDEPLLDSSTIDEVGVHTSSAIYDDTVEFQTTPIFVEKEETQGLEQVDSFWEEEEVEEKKYVDIILFIVLIILILVIVYMIV